MAVVDFLKQIREAGQGPRHAAIVIVDALGFKGLWARKGHDDAAKDWMEVASAALDAPSFMKDAIQKWAPKSPSTPSFDPEQVKFALLADTIMIAVIGREGDERSMLVRLGTMLLAVFGVALRMGILTRGAVAVGKTYVGEGQVIVGPAPDEAARWFDQAECATVTLTPAAYYTLGGATGKDTASLGLIFPRASVPMKGGASVDTRALAWPIALSDGDEVDAERQLMSALAKSAFGSGPEHYDKYSRTLRFFHEVRKSVRQGPPR